MCIIDIYIIYIGISITYISISITYISISVSKIDIIKIIYVINDIWNLYYVCKWFIIYVIHIMYKTNK